MQTVTSFTPKDKRAARKAELLRQFTTRKMRDLPGMVESLDPEDGDLLIEAYQEEVAKQRVTA